MALNLTTTNTYPDMKAVSVSTNWTEIQLPQDAQKITIGSANALYVGVSGATDGGTVGTDKTFVTANNMLELILRKDSKRSTSIFVAAQTGTATVSITLE
jgi:hypothetical protein|tara:strand:- start:2488 stop:2787 length:300 start_codon:yes stop_codon:yes gene_type:complete